MKHDRTRGPLALAIAWLLSGVVLGQPSPVLEEYIRQGLAGNLALQQQQIDVQRSIESVRQAKSLFYPTVQFSANYTVANGGRRIAFPVGDLLNKVYSTLNQLTGTSQFPQLENVNEQFLPNNFHETKFKIAYPLYNTDIRYNRQIREQLVESQQAQRAAYEHELRYHITEAYLQYLQSLEAEKIWLNTRTVLRELRRFNESLVQNNVATRDVVSTADYELSKVETEIVRLQSGQNTARAYFNFLINRDLQTEVIVDTTLLRARVQTYAPESLIPQALDARQELKALQAGVAASETTVKLNEANRWLPDAYIGGEVGFQGFGYTFDSEQRYALAQIGVTYDLFRGGQLKSKAQEARLDVEKRRVQQREVQQQIALQVTQAWNEYEAARQTYATAQTGQQAAESSFRIVSNKYKAQQALLLEYLDAENRVTAARLQTLLAWTDVLLKEAALRRVTGI